MKLCFISGSDYAHVFTKLCNLLNNYNYDVTQIKVKKHKFYNDDFLTLPKNKIFIIENLIINQSLKDTINNVIKSSDIIFWGREDQENILKKIINFNFLKGKKNIIYHQGLNFYLNYEKWNKNIMPIQSLITFNFDLLMNGIFYLGLPEKKIPFYPYVIKYINLGVNLNKNIDILHLPTNINFKGTNYIKDEIKNILKLIPNLNYDINQNSNLNNDQVIDKMKKSFIYIDWINDPKICNGGLGVSSFEALANGCIVITNMENISDEIWEFFEIEKPPVISCTREKGELSKILYNLLKYDGENMREKVINWSNKYLNEDQYIKSFNKILNHINN